MFKFKQGETYIRVNPKNRIQFYETVGQKVSGYNNITDITFGEKKGNIFIIHKTMNSKLLSMLTSRPLNIIEYIQSEQFKENFVSSLNGDFNLDKEISEILYPKFVKEGIVINNVNYSDKHTFSLNANGELEIRRIK